MKVWIIADDEGTEVEAASLEEAVEEYVRSWWAGLDDRPGRWAKIVAHEIVDRCWLCGGPLSDRDEVVPGSHVYRCTGCGASRASEYEAMTCWVPEPANIP